MLSLALHQAFLFENLLVTAIAVYTYHYKVKQRSTSMANCISIMNIDRCREILWNCLLLQLHLVACVFKYFEVLTEISVTLRYSGYGGIAVWSKYQSAVLDLSAEPSVGNITFWILDSIQLYAGA